METIKDLGSYTFQSLLKNSVKKFADRPALGLAGKEAISYQSLYEKSLEFSALLESYGMKESSKIAILSLGRPEWGQAYFGIVNRKMIAVPLLPDFSKNEIAAIFDHCGVDAIAVEERLYGKIKDIKKSLPKLIIKLDDFSVLSGKKVKTVKVENLKEVECHEEDTASIIYTSGTTGRSKGVELTNKNLVWNAVVCQSVHRVNKMDRCLSFLPLSHVYEFTIGFTMQVLNGSAIYYLGKPPVVSALLPAFKAVQPTIILSVPLIMEKIYKAKILPAFTKNAFMKFLSSMSLTKLLLCRKAGKELKKTFGGKLVFFGIGGSAVDPVVEKFMRLAKFPYAIGYGLTETSPLLAGSGVKITLPGTIGPILPGLDIRIINANSKGIGEIVVKGPNVMKGYYKEEALTKEVFTTENDECGAGYFKTGDLGLIKKRRGYYRLCLKGRIKNMILGPSGENIYPEDIEFVLNQHPFVNESLVVEDDTSLVALVNIDEEKVEAEAEARAKIKLPDLKEMSDEFFNAIAYQKEKILGEIQYFVNSRTNSSSRIGRVQQVPEFEKTASQKIKRYLYDLRTKSKKEKKALSKNEKAELKEKTLHDSEAKKTKEISSEKKVIEDPTRSQSVKRIDLSFDLENRTAVGKATVVTKAAAVTKDAAVTKAVAVTKETSVSKTATASQKKPSVSKTTKAAAVTKETPVSKTSTASQKKPSVSKTTKAAAVTKETSVSKTSTASTKKPSVSKTATASQKKTSVTKTATASQKKPAVSKTTKAAAVTKETPVSKTATASQKKPSVSKTSTASTKKSAVTKETAVSKTATASQKKPKSSSKKD